MAPMTGTGKAGPARIRDGAGRRAQDGEPDPRADPETGVAGPRPAYLACLGSRVATLAFQPGSPSAWAAPAGWALRWQSR